MRTKMLQYLRVRAHTIGMATKGFAPLAHFVATSLHSVGTPAVATIGRKIIHQ